MHSPAIRTLHPVISFLAFAILFQIIGGCIGWLTAQDVAAWYQGLSRSPLTPPDQAFGIVWSILYLMLAFSVWSVWRGPDTEDRGRILGLFAVHMALNWAWNPVFFTGHAVGAAFLMIFALIFTAAMLAFLIWPYNKLAAIVFAPYLGWLIFAGHLTQYIHANNPSVSNF